MALNVVEGTLSLLPGGKKLIVVEATGATTTVAATADIGSVNKIDYVIGAIREGSAGHSLGYEVSGPNQIKFTVTGSNAGGAIASFLIVGV